MKNSLDVTFERIKAVHWCFYHLTGFSYLNYDDFKCAIDQREAELLGLTNKKKIK